MRPRSTWMLVTADNGVDPQVVRTGDRGSWDILVRRAWGCEGAKPPCQCRAPSGAHIKKLGRRPAQMGGTQLGYLSVLAAGSSAHARKAAPARFPCSFGAGAATWQEEGARS